MTPGESVTRVEALGRELAVSLEPDRRQILQDEPVYLSLQVRLVRGESLILIEGGDYRNHLGRPESYALTATDVERGRSLPIRDAGPQLGGVVGGRRISADRPFRRRLLLAHWVRFDAAGAYRIAVDKQLRCAEEPWSAASMRESAAEVRVQVATKLEVRPSSPAERGAIIDEWGGRMLAADDTAWREADQALATIEDDRVVAYYVRLLQGRGERSFVALKRLCPHATDEAVEALGQALAEPMYRTYELVRGLGENRHPRALELLWSLRGDEAANIRLAVLQGLSRRHPADGGERMRAFLADPDPDVREEARQLLEALASES
ncbi:HEAT repeat domain-containing protein [Nannocystis bainbridge]|uniref:HEAT repeat domain-containing protein n=1 Tax=Nannocystis bainbridge TaxID=2995303 RepID=A0ABT5E6X5_9BACT|nr:HEAT repeat domain-containing protein [Nannocystis bainbridge]MDC0721615.1 HEAT repeat domain-containing protein [Nannocystis bainbridge]